eukprot:3937051-Rhodomonas_salina.1
MSGPTPLPPRHSTTAAAMHTGTTPAASVDDEATDDEIPLYARFLSYIAYRHVGHENHYETILAKDLWEQFRAWAKGNNFKFKINAAEFATALTEFCNTEDSGMRKDRHETQLFFSLHPAKLHAALKAQNLLDADVW